MSGEPSGTRRRAATDFQYVFVDYVAEQVVIALVQPFGAPDEFTFRAVHAQKLAVGSVVIVASASHHARLARSLELESTRTRPTPLVPRMELAAAWRSSDMNNTVERVMRAQYPGLPGKIADA